MPPDGRELLRRMAGGDRDACSVFYDLYAPLAFGLLCRMCPSAGEAEVVLHEVFQEIWQLAGDTGSTAGSGEALVVMQARRRAAGRARSRPLVGVREAAGDPLGPGRGRGHGDSEAGAGHTVLARLPPEGREVIRLAYFGGLTESEISERIGYSPDRVRTWTRRGLEELCRAGAPRWTSASDDSFSELLAPYALGSLAAGDLARVTAHLAAGCRACERVLDDFREALVGPAVEIRRAAPLRVKRELMAGLQSGEARGRRLRSGLRWTASVAIGSGLVASLVTTYVSGRYEARLGHMAREVTVLREQVRQQRLALTLLGDPATEIVLLAGLEPSPRARARMIWNGHAGGVFVAADLPPVPAERTYELWAIAGTRPLPAGIFRVDAEGRASLRVAALAGAPHISRFAVTLEAVPGVSRPTGPMYLASSSPTPSLSPR